MGGGPRLPRRRGSPRSERAAPAAKTCEPRRLTDDERRLAPPAGGEWDPAHRRSVGIVDGDVVVVDTVARTRTLITRTAAAEAHARWSDGGRAVTFVRDGGLHRVWVDRRPDQAGAASTVTAFEQLTDAGPPKPRPPATDSQQFLKSEEAQLLAVVRENEARKARADARKDAQAVVRVAVGERQSVDDLVLAHQGKVAYALVVDKPAAARRADVPSYVTGSSYPELLPGRTHVGDAQEARRLVAVDLAAKSDTTVSLSGAEIDPRAGPLLWSLPVVSDDGSHAATIVVSADNKHRYVAALGPTPGTDADRRAPARHRVGARPRRVRPAADDDGLRARHGAALVPVRARRLDAPLRRRSRRARMRRRGSSRAAPGRSPTRSSRPTASSSSSRRPRPTPAIARSTRCRSRAARAPG